MATSPINGTSGVRTNSAAAQITRSQRTTGASISSPIRSASDSSDSVTISNSSPPKKNWLSRTGEKIGGYFHNIGAQVKGRKGLAKIPGFIDGVMAPIDQLTDGIADGIAGKKSPEGRKLGRIITRAAVGAGIGFAVGGPVGAAIGAGIGILLGAFSNVDSNEPAEAKQGEGAPTPAQGSTGRVGADDVPASGGSEEEEDTPGTQAQRRITQTPESADTPARPAPAKPDAKATDKPAAPKPAPVPVVPVDQKIERIINSSKPQSIIDWENVNDDEYIVSSDKQREIENALKTSGREPGELEGKIRDILKEEFGEDIGDGEASEWADEIIKGWDELLKKESENKPAEKSAEKPVAKPDTKTAAPKPEAPKPTATPPSPTPAAVPAKTDSTSPTKPIASPTLTPTKAADTGTTKPVSR